jgi:hypothetical protein
MITNKPVQESHGSSLRDRERAQSRPLGGEMIGEITLKPILMEFDEERKFTLDLLSRFAIGIHDRTFPGHVEEARVHVSNSNHCVRLGGPLTL